MSLYGMMRTGVSGMQAQATRLSAVSDNIANSSTTGYKKSGVEFSTLVMPGNAGGFSSGGVNTDVRRHIEQQGVLNFSNSSTDLAVDGDGFFVVENSAGVPFLTRAGSFVPDGEGRLVNAAGYFLSGYDFSNGPPTVVANGFAGLTPITVTQAELTATASTAGRFLTNLPSDQAVTAAPLPSANLATSEYSHKSSVVTYDNVGGEQLIDIYYTKTAANTWEMTAYHQPDATAFTGFPYASGPLVSQTITFDPANGDLAGASPTTLAFTVPGGALTTLDLTGTKELAADFQVLGVDVNGKPPAEIEQVSFDADGTLYAQYNDGSFKALARIPLATVVSPNLLNALPGNVYSQSTDSGDLQLGFPNESAFGSVVAGALEGSNVDLAGELTEMIQAQRTYTANSKVFQTGSELMEVLVNLKR